MRFAWTLVCLSLAMAQSIAPDEIHARTVAYTPPSLVTARTEVRLVEVPVVVRDEKQRAVVGLTRDDFEIRDEGKPQAITAFSVQSSASVAGQGVASDAANSKSAPRPRFMALVFDDLHLVPVVLQPLKDAATRFVKNSLAPGDRMVVVTTSQSKNSQFSSDVPTLVEQIAKVGAATQRADDVSPCPRIRPYEAYQIANHMDPGDQVLGAKMAECAACLKHECPQSMVVAKAMAIWGFARTNSTNTLGVVDSLVDGMAKLPGQRMILLTSTGFLMGTLETAVDRLMDKARHMDVVINSLETGGAHLTASGGWTDDGLAVLASGTGGAFFHNDNDLDGGFRQLGMAPEVMYALSFAPSGAADGHFHKLKVQLTAGKRYSVEARLGYSALPPNAAGPGSALSRMDSEVTATDTVTDLPVSFTWEQWAGPPGITMIAHLDIGHLNFKPWEGRRTQKLIIVATVLDSHGSFVAGKRSELELSLMDATFARLEKEGFPAAMTIQAPPGNYSVRAVAQDAVEGKLSAASGAVEVK